MFTYNIGMNLIRHTIKNTYALASNISRFSRKVLSFGSNNFNTCAARNVSCALDGNNVFSLENQFINSNKTYLRCVNEG